MLWKVILIFLCLMALVAMIGKLLFPTRAPKGRIFGLGKSSARCRDCGRPRLTPGPCDCARKRR